METTPELAAEGSALVRVLSTVLDRLVSANAPLAVADPGQVTKFHALKAPGIGVHQYLERIHKYASCSNECFVLALVYIDRLIQRNNFLLTELNVHRVVITAVLLAAKFFDDAYYNNAYYAKVGGVLVSEMNGLEVDFLFRINFSLHVTPELFHKYRAELASHSAAAGVSLPEMSPALHMRSPAYHGEQAMAGGAVTRRTETVASRQMQTDVTEKRSDVNGAFITPSPPSDARGFPSDPSSNGYPSTASTESFPHGVASAPMKVHPTSQHAPFAQYSSGPAVVGMSDDSGMEMDGQFAVVDNVVAYPSSVPVGITHASQTSAPQTGSLGTLLQHYQASSAPTNGFRPHSQSDPTGAVQHFVGGRNMLTGVSSGM